LGKLLIDRDQFREELKRAGVGCSVHWRPLHLHPYYRDVFGSQAKEFPVATSLWQRAISLPIFQGMCDDEVEHVISTVRSICERHASPGLFETEMVTAQSKRDTAVTLPSAGL
jgi:perosamine synthetase